MYSLKAYKIREMANSFKYFGAGGDVISTGVNKMPPWNPALLTFKIIFSTVGNGEEYKLN